MKINEFDKQVTQSDIDELEKFADKIFAKVGIDVNFTRHFLDRVNDERNGKPISMSELTRLFKQEQKRWGKKIAQLGPDEEAVMKDLQTDLNLPFALRWDDKNNELDLIAKTVMRKKNFKTPNPEFPVENVDPVDMAAAAGVSGAVGSMIGNKVGKAVDRDLRGDGPQDRRMRQRFKQDRLKKLTKTPSIRGNANTATKPTSAPMTAKLPGVTRGGAGAGGAAINPKRIGGGGRLEPKLRSTPFNMFNESGEINQELFEDWYNNYYRPVRDKFPQIGNAIKNAGGNPFSKRSVQNLVKRNPDIVQKAGDIAKKYANLPDPVARIGASIAGVPKDQVDFGLNMRSKFKKEYPKAWNDVTQGNMKGALNKLGIATESLPPHLAKHFDKDGDAVKGSWKDGKWTADKKQPKKVKYTVKDVTPKGYGPLDEDFGSVPPLAELIVMAVVAKTSVDVLIGMFKVALKTGKGLKKLNDLRKRVAKMGQGVADYALPEATKDELIAKATERKNQAFYDAALNALHRLVSSKGTKQSVGGYAFDIARAFNGVNAKELETMYRAKFSESIIHEDTLTELNILRKKNDGVKQSNPLVVLDKLADRRDDTPFPIKFYDGTTIKVTPKMARRFMNKYYDDLEPEQRDIVDRYITTKNGFIQAVKKLQIAEGK